MHRSRAVRSRRHPAAALATLVLLAVAAAVPSGAQARRVTFGSSLSGPVTQAYARGVDTALWSRSLAGRRATAPAKGRVISVRLEGCAVAEGAKAPLTRFHIQTLHPRGGSSASVFLTGGPFNLPVCGHGGSDSTITTFQTGNLCAHKGDYVAFNDEGGFGAGYPGGVPYRVLRAAPGATTDAFTGANRTNNGASITGHALAGTELAMQMTLGTGQDAGVCNTV